MLKIKNISSKNFKSIEGDFFFSFEGKESGLHQIYGKVGSGKSTILDLISWIFFGKTSQGLKAGDVHSWKVPGGTSGEINFTLNDKDYCLERQWKPNKLLLNGEKIDQVDITNLGLKDALFGHSVHIAQAVEMFFDLDPAPKLALISGVLDQDHWLECSKKASQEEDALSNKITSIQNKIEYINGSLDQLAKQAETYDENNDSFEKEKKREIAALGSELNGAKSALRLAESDLKSLQDDRDGKDKEMESKATEIGKMDTDIDGLFSQVNGLLDEEQKLESSIESIEKNVKKFENLGTACPSCEQKVSKKHVQTHLTEFEQELAALEKKKTPITKQIDDINSHIGQLEDFKHDLEREYAVLEREHDGIQKKIYEVDSRVDYNQRLVLGLEQKRIELKNKENPYMELLNNVLDQADKLENEITEKEDEIKELQKELAAVEYWSKKFKELRLYVIQEILSHLEVEVNNYIGELGLENWSVSFDIEKENKSGSVGKGFYVFIKSPNSPDNVPWKSFSGGEKQSLRVCGQLALSNLILQSIGLDSNVLFIDEPTTHLTKLEIDGLLNVLSTKAEDEDKQIYMIDHHVYDYGNFKTTTEVTKDGPRSRIT